MTDQPSLALSLAADWLCTFALHSTCALALALLVSRLCGQRAVAAQEHVLRTSLWLALFSATFQVFVFGGPWSAGLALPRVPPFAMPATIGVPDAAIVQFDLAPLHRMEPPPMELPWAAIVVAVASVFGACGLAWFWSVHRRLCAVLAGRSPELDLRVLRTAAEVARESGLHQTPHLSRCERLATPIAFGWWRPEICLPLRTSELGDASLRAMIAHEIAHLRRADPAWMWVVAALQAVFPWQPLLIVVRRRWARLVELRCDAIAARHSSSTAVARCLLDVAEWLRPDAPQPRMALAMAARASSLRERIEAALHPDRVGSPSRLLTIGWSATSLVALTIGGPGVRSAADGVIPPIGSPALVAERSSSLQGAMELLEAERRALVAEAGELQRELAVRPTSPELESMHALLRARLSQLERASARVQARLARSPSEAR